ncbi:MAG: MFS transporter [Gammaproteobacteria bacterium]|nr:MFS transporter [Gammaproteobacteria bacterium]
MSIIVAVRKGDQAVLAADTAQSDDTLIMKSKYLLNHNKLVQAGDSWIGLAGWSASQDIFESLVRNHEELMKFGTRQEIFDSFIKIHKLMKDEYFIDTQEDKEQPVESSQMSAIIVNPNGLFEIESYRSVSEYSQFWALGSGKRLALGALHALYDQSDDVVAIAKAAVTAACEFDDGCALPLTWQAITLTPPAAPSS